MSVSIELPWPAKELHPNGRSHYMAKAREAKKARSNAHKSALAAGIRLGDFDIPQALRVTVTFMPKTRNAFDLDNALAALKSSLDGIADAIGVDDSKWHIALRKEEPVKGGLVRIELERVNG